MGIRDWIRWPVFRKPENVPPKNPLLRGEDTGEGGRQNILSIPDAVLSLATLNTSAPSHKSISRAWCISWLKNSAFRFQIFCAFCAFSRLIVFPAIDNRQDAKVLANGHRGLAWGLLSRRFAYIQKLLAHHPSQFSDKL